MNSKKKERIKRIRENREMASFRNGNNSIVERYNVDCYGKCTVEKGVIDVANDGSTVERWKWEVRIQNYQPKSGLCATRQEAELQCRRAVSQLFNWYK